MSEAITGGRQRTTAARVYDRLRKRSYRGWRRSKPFWIPLHVAYVEGVKDALNALEKEYDASV